MIENRFINDKTTIIYYFYHQIHGYEKYSVMNVKRADVYLNSLLP
jgi:hypothetical protein